MGTKPRQRPEHLATKLLAIRQHLGLSQSQIAALIGFNSYQRISEYENGAREPNLMVLLRYSEIVSLHMEMLVDDRVDVVQFRAALTAIT